MYILLFRIKEVIVWIFLLNLCLLYLFTIFVHNLCSQSFVYNLCSQSIVYNLCLQFLFTIFVYNLCLKSLFTIFVYKLCLQTLFTNFVYNLCLQSLFTNFVSVSNITRHSKLNVYTLHTPYDLYLYTEFTLDIYFYRYELFWNYSISISAIDLND